MTDNLAGDFVAIWQSEMAAMAADRELRETWVQLLGLWAQTAARITAHDPTAGSPRPAEPPRPTAPDAASGARDDEVEQLNRRVAELERRLAELGAGTPAPAGDA